MARFTFASTPFFTNISFDDWDPYSTADNTEWWSGVNRQISWRQSAGNPPTGATKINLYLCKETGYNNSALYYNTHFNNTGYCAKWGEATSGAANTRLALGNSDGRLYDRLVAAKLDPGNILNKYYSEAGNNFRTYLYICNANSNNQIVGVCSDAKELLVLPKDGGTGGWTSWSRCDAITCSVDGQRTRVCKAGEWYSPGVPACSGERTETCRKAGCPAPASPTVSLGLAPLSPWDDLDPSDFMNWWSGSSRAVSWTFLNGTTGIDRVGLYLCKSSSYTDPVRAVHDPNSCQRFGETTSVVYSKDMTLGPTNGSLYTDLVSANLPNPSSPLDKYYTKSNGDSRGDTFVSYLHVCALNSSGQVVGSCPNRQIVVLPRLGFNNGWTEWTRCSEQTVCGVAGTRTRTRLVAPFSPLIETGTCYKPGCGVISNLDVRDFNEATDYWLAGQTKTVTWRTAGTVDRVSLAICGRNQVYCNNIRTGITNNGSTTLTMPSDFAFNEAYVRLESSGLNTLTTSNFKVGPATGVYSNWSTCSAPTCQDQTRSCLSGAGTCTELLSRECVASGCDGSPSQPSVSNFRISDPPLFNIPDIPNGKGWPAGSTANLNFDYRDFSAGKKSVTTAICHPDDDTSCTYFPNESITFSAGSGTKTLARTLGQTRLYERLLNNEAGLMNYYKRTTALTKIYFEADFRLCVSGGGTCQIRKFYVAEPGSAPIIEGMPTVRNVRIDNLESGTIWRAGLYKDIRWGYNWFASPSPKTVSLSICHKDDTNGSRCLPWSGGVNNPADNQIMSWTGSPVGSNLTNNRRIHPDVYDWLVAGRRDGNLSLFDAGGPPFQAKARICPTYSPGHGVVGATVGQNVNPSLGSYSPVFNIEQNPNRVEGPGYGLPSGQGCFVGECVCINGQKARCGNPMRSGATCPAMTGCPGVLTITTSDKMLASVSWVFDWFIGLFRK